VLLLDEPEVLVPAAAEMTDPSAQSLLWILQEAQGADTRPTHAGCWPCVSTTYLFDFLRLLAVQTKLSRVQGLGLHCTQRKRPLASLTWTLAPGLSIAVQVGKERSVQDGG